MTVLYVYDGLGFSFRKVMSLLEKGLREIGYQRIDKVDGHTAFQVPKNFKTVMITDIILAARWGWITRFLPYTDKMVLWCDTPLSLRHLEPYADLINERTCNYVTLPCYINIFRLYGIKVDGYIPRPIDIDTANEAVEASCRDIRKEYGDYIITVGGDQILAPPRYPRKGLDMYDRLCEWLKRRYGYMCLAVTNWVYFKHVDHVIKFGSLSEFDLLRLVKCAKLFVWTSRGEGFGMPPIEAMAVGQLVVAADNPTNELIVGVKFPIDTVEEVYMPEIGMYYYAYLYRFEELRDAVDYALNMPEDEKVFITIRAMREARKFHPRYVALAVSQL